MMIIRDPSTGRGAEVISEGCLCTRAVTVPLSAYTNVEDGDCYSVVVDRAIASANHFLYLKNTSDMSMRITRMRGFVSADVELYILRAVTGTATSPSTLTPANRNFGSGKTADGTFQQGAALALTGGTEIDRWMVDFSENPTFDIVWRSEFILPKNQTLVVAGTAAATINMIVSLHYRS